MSKISIREYKSKQQKLVCYRRYRRCFGTFGIESCPHIEKAQTSISAPYRRRDYIIVINAGKIKVTGNKLADKIYHKHTGYIGNMKSTPLEKDVTKKTRFCDYECR